MLRVFDPVIYPRSLYVIDNIEELNKFTDIGGNGLLPADTYGATYNVMHKKTSIYGSLIFLNIDELRNKLGSYIVNVICHESFHAADCIFDNIDAEVSKGNTNEHMAYLIGWVAECCWKTVNQLLYQEKEETE